VRGAEVGSEAAYYQAIEEFFVSRRGDPLLLSNADWLLIRKWRRAGIPLRIVLRGITDALDSHAHSWGRSRKVGSLHYCAAEVDAAQERWGRAVAGGGGVGSLTERLGELEKALMSPRGLRPAAAAELARILAAFPALRQRAAADIEAELGALERKLLASIRREMDPQALARTEGDVEADLAPYRTRMPEKVATQIRADALARTLLGAHGLPRLTLFS
jgi:hypothetical protein